MLDHVGSQSHSENIVLPKIGYYANGHVNNGVHLKDLEFNITVGIVPYKLVMDMNPITLPSQIWFRKDFLVDLIEHSYSPDQDLESDYWEGACYGNMKWHFDFDVSAKEIVGGRQFVKCEYGGRTYCWEIGPEGNEEEIYPGHVIGVWRD